MYTLPGKVIIFFASFHQTPLSCLAFFYLRISWLQCSGVVLNIISYEISLELGIGSISDIDKCCLLEGLVKFHVFVNMFSKYKDKKIIIPSFPSFIGSTTSLFKLQKTLGQQQWDPQHKESYIKPNHESSIIHIWKVI